MSVPHDVALRELKARQDIHDVLTRYCRGADRCDATLIKSCYHADAWDDHGFFKGPASEFADRAAKSLSQLFVSTRHFMTNEYVEVEGDQAKSETYILCIQRMIRDGEKFDVIGCARYLDRFERRNRVWKIAHRLFVSDGNRVEKVQEENPLFNQGRPGARGEDDPYFSLFAPVPT